MEHHTVVQEVPMVPLHKKATALCAYVKAAARGSAVRTESE